MVWHPPTEIYEGVVEHHIFKLGDYTTIGGALIKDVQVGYETTGKLAEDCCNAILIPPPVTGTSHFAGVCQRNPKVRHGYWDTIVGPGKPLDTDRYFLISVESLCAITAEDQLDAIDHQRLTTGPASINPDTGRPFGMTFPLIQFRDLVEIQARVLASLGIRRLHAVVGFSAGGAQAMEWGAFPPIPVERIVSVAGMGMLAPYGMAKVSAWREAIMLDSNWNRGDYYQNAEGGPFRGLALACRLFLTDITGPSEFDAKFGRRWAEEDKDPTQTMDNKYSIFAHLDNKAEKTAFGVDANSLMYMTRCIETFSVGINQDNPVGAQRMEDAADMISVPALLMSAKNDQLAIPAYVRRTVRLLEEQGKYVKYFELDGDRGHMNGTFALTSPGVEENRHKAKKVMKTFLSNQLLEIEDNRRRQDVIA